MVVVVSEETGVISLAVDGVVERGLDTEQLGERLAALLGASHFPRSTPVPARRGPPLHGGARRDGIRALLAENWPLKLASLVFAIGLWMFVATEERTEAVFTCRSTSSTRPPACR